ncbi:MAG: hypothetical protein JSW71_06275 [Gemmatimonadota bacterium]|nr:MAG: hypothetical protein JSW71_06275 [Gemmatimonadota bacterium]
MTDALDRVKAALADRTVATKVLPPNHLRFALGLMLSGLLGVATACFVQQSIWTPKADMPTPRWSPASSVVNGKIYIIGGTVADTGNRRANLQAVEVYDPETDTWIQEVDMPTARGWLSSSVVDGKLYAIGGGLHSQLGTSEPMVLATVEEFVVPSPW